MSNYQFRILPPSSQGYFHFDADCGDDGCAMSVAQEALLSLQGVAQVWSGNRFVAGVLPGDLEPLERAKPSVTSRRNDNGPIHRNMVML